MRPKEWFQQIHERLLCGDPVASSELAEEVWELLLSRLRKKHPRLANTHFLSDSVSDALISYIKRPTQFDPKQRGLLGFLFMAAEGDFRNALARAKRQSRGEVPLEGVELELIGGKHPDEELVQPKIADVANRRLRELFQDPADREAVKLIADGERSTSAFAKLWAVEALTPRERRREVKRRKDRIKKVLERHGKDKR